MKKILTYFLILVVIPPLFFSCQTVTKKIDATASKEEIELSKWLNQPETELKIVFGVPDEIEITNKGTKHYIYISKKLKIKCERKFEINSNNIIIGFSSKNCF
jgi:hypothetical protein